jgi:hypothetical protein
MDICLCENSLLFWYDELTLEVCASTFDTPCIYE